MGLEEKKKNESMKSTKRRQFKKVHGYYRPFICSDKPVRVDHFSSALAETTNALFDDSASCFTTADCSEARAELNTSASFLSSELALTFLHHNPHLPRNR